jgi:hypothetical protein
MYNLDIRDNFHLKIVIQNQKIDLTSLFSERAQFWILQPCPFRGQKLFCLDHPLSPPASSFDVVDTGTCLDVSPITKCQR